MCHLHTRSIPLKSATASVSEVGTQTRYPGLCEKDKGDLTGPQLSSQTWIGGPLWSLHGNRHGTRRFGSESLLDSAREEVARVGRFSVGGEEVELVRERTLRSY